MPESTVRKAANEAGVGTLARALALGALALSLLHVSWRRSLSTSTLPLSFNELHLPTLLKVRGTGRTQVWLAGGGERRMLRERDEVGKEEVEAAASSEELLLLSPSPKCYGLAPLLNAADKLPEVLCGPGKCRVELTNLRPDAEAA